MTYYRLYSIDVGGHIVDVRDGFFDDDATAEAEALRIDHAALIEIWRQDRKVSEVRPEQARRRR